MEQALWHGGKGKIWLTNGRVFIGDFYRDKLQEGYLYEIQKDNRFTRFKVKYDAEHDLFEGENGVIPNQ
jgi:hypothetical protein